MNHFLSLIGGLRRSLAAIFTRPDAEVEETPERQRLDAWSAAHPRDDLALILIAAWCNVRVDQLPEKTRQHTCEASMVAWGRVADAVRAALAETGK